METFCLYLALLSKPRIDEGNLIKCFPTQEACQLMQNGYTELNKELLGVPTYTWKCVNGYVEQEVLPQSEKTSQGY